MAAVPAPSGAAVMLFTAQSRILSTILYLHVVTVAMSQEPFGLFLAYNSFTRPSCSTTTVLSPHFYSRLRLPFSSESLALDLQFREKRKTHSSPIPSTHGATYPTKSFGKCSSHSCGPRPTITRSADEPTNPPSSHQQRLLCTQ